MTIEWISALSKLNKLPGFSATAEHVALLKDLYEQLQKECEQLRVDLEACRHENTNLKNDLSIHTKTRELVEHEGLFWRKGLTGGVESKPRCPNCADRPVLSQFPPNARLHWTCSKCNGCFDYADPPTV